MMTPDYTVYVNGLYFDSLANSSVFGDRPEPYRNHEKSLWTIYQLLRLGEHEVVITDKMKHTAFKTRNADELKLWFKQFYPEFIKQLDGFVYTAFPHPNDWL